MLRCTLLQVSESLKPFPDDWSRALCIAAHPDDLEYGTASAVAAWTAAGKTVTLRPGHLRRGGHRLPRSRRVRPAPGGRGAGRRGRGRRRRRSSSSAAIQDGVVEYGLPLRRDLARVIRRRRPDLVVMSSPDVRPLWGGIDQADHRAVEPGGRRCQPGCRQPLGVSGADRGGARSVEGHATPRSAIPAGPPTPSTSRTASSVRWPHSGRTSGTWRVWANPRRIRTKCSRLRRHGRRAVRRQARGDLRAAGLEQGQPPASVRQVVGPVGRFGRGLFAGELCRSRTGVVSRGWVDTAWTRFAGSGLSTWRSPAQTCAHALRCPARGARLGVSPPSEPRPVIWAFADDPARRRRPWPVARTGSDARAGSSGCRRRAVADGLGASASGSTPAPARSAASHRARRVSGLQSPDGGKAQSSEPFDGAVKLGGAATRLRRLGQHIGIGRRRWRRIDARVESASIAVLRRR